MRIFLSTIALTACASLASAADLGGSVKDGPYGATQYNWSGLYVGGHVGLATGGWSGNMHYSDHDPNGPYIFNDSTKKLEDDEWLGGLQIGFNRQQGSLVWGLEADVSWSHLGDSREFSAYTNLNESGWALDAELEQFGTVRGRLGFLITPRLLLYGTGGFAWGKAEINKESRLYNPDGTFARVTGTGSADENHFGWAAGLGGEFMLADNWTIRGEWLHIDLGKERYHLKGTTSGGNPFLTDSFPADLTFDVFRLGVNYKFGG